MRDYVLSQSRARRHSIGLIWSLVGNWQSRRNFARLAKLSDYQLRDIGLTRSDVSRLSCLPLSVDPVWEADRLRLLNARSVD